MSLFCRAPVPGATKTRLTPPLTPEQAAALSLALLLDAADALRGAGHPVEARVADAAHTGILRGLLGELAVLAQGEGDLGARMERASREALGPGRAAVAIVGSDCPAIAPRHLEGAFLALAEGADAAICPSADGGYGLIALSRPCPALFERIPWSTDGVLGATRRAAQASGLRLAVLEPLDDVDRPQDLDGLAERLERVGAAPRTRHLLYRLGYA